MQREDGGSGHVITGTDIALFGPVYMWVFIHAEGKEIIVLGLGLHILMCQMCRLVFL